MSQEDDDEELSPPVVAEGLVRVLLLILLLPNDLIDIRIGAAAAKTPGIEGAH